MSHNDLLPFQACTVKWVLKQLNGKSRPAYRFLVADEVGLGKTKVAAEIIRSMLKDKGRLTVLYVTSNLDICQQNRQKLCDDPKGSIVQPDRICLLYSQKLKRNGLKIISVTPSTSLNLARGTGSMAERVYIARYLSKRFGISKSKLVERLSGAAEPRNFEKRYDEHRSITPPPSDVCARIDRAWKNAGLIELLKSAKTSKDTWGKLISGLRSEMAKAIVIGLNPDLVILDEVQKFRDVIEIDDQAEIKHPVARNLLLKTTPTLILSATPYRAYIGAGQANASHSHVEELQMMLGFLTGSRVEAEFLARRVREYAEIVKAITPEKIETVLIEKEKLESDLKKYMSRAERVNFEDSSHLPFIEKRMPGEKYPISASHLREWLKVKDLVTSKRSFLHLWRSGNAPLSYMHGDYKILRGFDTKSGKRILKDKSLYTRLGQENSHGKLEYLKTNLLQDGHMGNYLWLPPTKSYYEGLGCFAPDVLSKIDVKKGLVFSSWGFVPRYVSSELSAWQNKKNRSKPAKHPLKDNTLNWGRFWHPSIWLATLVTHQELTKKQQSYTDLLSYVESIIRDSLIKKGWKIAKSNTEAWEILFKIDVEPNNDWLNGLWDLFLKKRNEFTRRDQDRAGAMPYDQVNRLINGNEIEKVISPKRIRDIAEIALTSPAVCLLRTLAALKLLDAQKVNYHSMALISDFCARNWKAYFNREGVAKVIDSTYGNRLTYAEKMQRYLRDGNFQAVLDEYIYHIRPMASETAYKEILQKLAVVFGPKGGNLNVRVSQGKTKRVRAEMITLFGKSDELTQSRESIREAFNSPFWPHVLVTTSVGQEGLDFHLYCRDIYHWNLPSNPVDFEQREGRINRFNSLWVRQSIVNSVDFQIDSENEFFWHKLYTEAPKFAHRNDRFNLGMAPHWTFTPATMKGGRGYFRHILALQGTEEWPRYEALMKDLTLYRLTLGQPNQAGFLRELKKNSYLKEIDPRAVTLCLFPYDQEYLQSSLVIQHESIERWHLLVKDARELLTSLRRRSEYSQLKRHVERHIKVIRTATSAHKIAVSVAALLYFVNPHDEIHDRTPGLGLGDDLKKLKVS